MRQRRCGRKSCGHGPPGRKPRLDGPLSLFPTAALLRRSWRLLCSAATSSTGTLATSAVAAACSVSGRPLPGAAESGTAAPFLLDELEVLIVLLDPEPGPAAGTACGTT